MLIVGREIERALGVFDHRGQVAAHVRERRAVELDRCRKGRQLIAVNDDRLEQRVARIAPGEN